MNQTAVVLFCGLLSVAALPGQIEQLATSSDGTILLVHTRFRLQTETDPSKQGKIYRWQDGRWTRLAAAQDLGFAISPPDFFSPFLSSDLRVIGWQINVGCILCQIQVGPTYSSQVSGATLPDGFPRGTLRMSANGRYFTGDNYPLSGVKYLDSVTGAVTDLPVDFRALRWFVKSRTMELHWY